MKIQTRAPAWLWMAMVGLVAGAGIASLRSGVGIDGSPGEGSTALPSGPEIVLMFFGSESCGFSQLPITQTAVEEAKHLVGSQAREAGLRFSSHGVANDPDPTMGMEFLLRFGPWDEVSLGRGWANTMVMGHLFDESHVGVGIPEVIVLKRTLSYELGPDSLVVGYHSDQEQEIARLTGAEAIRDWVERGAPLALVPDSAG